MSEEASPRLIKEKIREFGYNSVNFQLALIHEEELWKVMASRAIFSSSNPLEHKTLLKESNFVLENFYLSLDEFERFLDYLRTVYVGNVGFEEGRVKITDELLFRLASYKLCFIGNFMSEHIYFCGRSISKKYHGIDRPIYYMGYAIYESGRVKSFPQLDLTGYEVPFRDVTEAINYFWDTHYEKYQIPMSFDIYMPIFEASIFSCKVKGTNLIVKIDIDNNSVGMQELSLGVIAEGQDNEYRERHQVREYPIEINLGFLPNTASITLSKLKRKLDEYNYYSPESEKSLSTIALKDNAVIVGDSSRETEQGGIQIEKEGFLFDIELYRTLPDQMKRLLIEAKCAFSNQLYRAAAILLRSALEEGITLIIRKIGKDSDLYENEFEIGLQKKIRLLTDSVPQFRKIKTDLDAVKWWGDKASHEASMPICKNDVSKNIEPKLRLFLARLLTI